MINNTNPEKHEANIPGKIANLGIFLGICTVAAGAVIGVMEQHGLPLSTLSPILTAQAFAEAGGYITIGANVFTGLQTINEIKNLKSPINVENLLRVGGTVINLMMMDALRSSLK